MALLSGPPAGSVVVEKAAAQLLPSDPVSFVLADRNRAMTSFLNPGGKSGARELRISAWAIENPTPWVMAFIALTVGLFSAMALLPVKNYPNVEFPVVVVSVTQSGAAPQELKTQVTRPVEDALTGITDVQTIASNVSQGDSETRIQFSAGTNMGQPGRTTSRPRSSSCPAGSTRGSTPHRLALRLRRPADHHLWRLAGCPGVDHVGRRPLVDRRRQRHLAVLQGVDGVGCVSRPRRRRS